MSETPTVEQVESNTLVDFDLSNVLFTEQDFTNGPASDEESQASSLHGGEGEENTSHGVCPSMEHSYASFYRHEDHATDPTIGRTETVWDDALRHEVNGGFGDPANEDTGDGPTALLTGKAD